MCHVRGARYAVHARNEEGIALLRHQTCKACGIRDKWNFHVPDEVWLAVVPKHLQNRVVCLPCFDEFAKEQGVDYAAHISALYFAGDGAAFEFGVVSAANVAD
jgi:hypothetical protein